MKRQFKSKGIQIAKTNINKKGTNGAQFYEKSRKFQL